MRSLAAGTAAGAPTEYRGIGPSGGKGQREHALHRSTRPQKVRDERAATEGWHDKNSQSPQDSSLDTRFGALYKGENCESSGKTLIFETVAKPPGLVWLLKGICLRLSRFMIYWASHETQN
jgi:hypothetical protein